MLLGTARQEQTLMCRGDTQSRVDLVPLAGGVGGECDVNRTTEEVRGA
jgi:hypothetical protein